MNLSGLSKRDMQQRRIIVYLAGIFAESLILKSTRQPAISFWSWIVRFCKAGASTCLIWRMWASGNKTSFTNQLSLSSWSAPPVMRFRYSPPWTQTWMIAEQMANSIWVNALLPLCWLLLFDDGWVLFLRVLVIMSSTKWRMFARLTVVRMTASAFV